MIQKVFCDNLHSDQPLVHDSCILRKNNWIYMTLAVNIPQQMNPNIFGDSLTFSLVLPLGK